MISVVSGPCARGAAYSPALGDFTIMTAEAVMFLTGPKIIERVTREVIGAAELGGPKVQAANGVAQLVARDDVHAAELTRELLTYLPDRVGGAGAPLVPPADAPDLDPGDVLPESDRKVYDVREVAMRLTDRGGFFEVAAKWARNLVVGFGRIEGRTVGVIANQPKHLGGCLDADAAEKGAWFVDLCDRFAIPLVVLADTPGFLPGAKQEHAAVLRHGASLLRAFGRASVPRVTVTLRQAYGGAHIVMNSRDLGATLTLAWPGARIGVMGARQAVELVRRREIEAGADAVALADAEHLPVRVAAAAGFVDEVIAPSETRDRIAHVLELAKT
jgi:acetyl-CoA carboxylase carboxyltransferase component